MLNITTIVNSSDTSVSGPTLGTNRFSYHSRPIALTPTTRVSIPAEAELTEPVRITVEARDLARVNGHLVVEAGHHSKATVVLTHRGSAECGAAVEIKVGDGADLTFVTVQEWDDDTLHVTQNDALIGRDARLRHIVVTLGGRIVRVSTNARYAGPGAVLLTYHGGEGVKARRKVGRR